MAKRLLNPNPTGVKVLLYVPRQDGSGPLAGLTAAAAGLSLAYYRAGAAAAVAVPLVALPSLDAAFTPGGFREVDPVGMPGVYLVHLPDAAFGTGAESVAFALRGAALMAPVALEFALGFLPVNVVQHNGEAVLASDVPVAANLVQVGGAALVGGRVPAAIDASAPLPANLVQVAGAGLIGGAVPASLVPGGLDAVPTAETGGIAGHGSLPGRINALYERFYGPSRYTVSAFETLASDGSVRTSQPIDQAPGDGLWTMGVPQ